MLLRVRSRPFSSTSATTFTRTARITCNIVKMRRGVDLYIYSLHIYIHLHLHLHRCGKRPEHRAACRAQSLNWLLDAVDAAPAPSKSDPAANPRRLRVACYI